LKQECLEEKNHEKFKEAIQYLKKACSYSMKEERGKYLISLISELDELKDTEKRDEIIEQFKDIDILVFHLLQEFYFGIKIT